MNCFFNDNCRNNQGRRSGFVEREEMEKEEFKDEERKQKGGERAEKQEEFKDEEKCRDEVIKNKAAVEIKICGQKHLFESNEVEAKKINIVVKKEQSCEFYFPGDVIEYKVKIFNDSDCGICGCLFEDIIPKGKEFLKNSFKVNGKKERAEFENGKVKFELPELKKKEELLISFDVRV